MGGFSSESDSWVSSATSIEENPESQIAFLSNRKPIKSTKKKQIQLEGYVETTDDDDLTRTKKKNQIQLEGYVRTTDDDDLTRTKSLTDEDLDELKGCLDLGFGFSYDEIPELCNTLPALELCYSMSQKFIDDHQKSPENSMPVTSATSETCSGSSPIANWKISSPGDHPEDVKARLKFWAQAVACTVKLCT